MACILLVEDDQGVRTLTREILEGAGHIVSEAADGAIGVTRFKAERFDLVITDLIMPEQEGIETIQIIRRLNRVVPIIAISGGGRGEATDYLQVALKLGADAALAKPFSPAELRDLVRTWLAFGVLGPDAASA